MKIEVQERPSTKWAAGPSPRLVNNGGLNLEPFLDPFLGPSWSQIRSKMFFEPNLEPTWSHIGPTYGQLGANLAQLGVNLGPTSLQNANGAEPRVVQKLIKNVSWEALGDLLGLLEVDLTLDIILERLNFRKGRLGAVLGSIFNFFEAILELFFKAFWLLLPQQIQHKKSTIY